MKRLAKKYIWTAGAFDGNPAPKFYIEGSIESDPAARRVQWRLIDNTGTIVARDAVRFIVELQNVIFVGIDGTGSAAWLSGPHGHTPNNSARWNSHVRNLCVEAYDSKKYVLYLPGPADGAFGSDSPAIHAEALSFIVSSYILSQNTAKIAITGWSRGAMIAQWVANELSDMGIGVDFVGLYDPVDMSEFIPDISVNVFHRIDRVGVVGPTDGVNFDYLHFLRMAGYITPIGNNTIIELFALDASHGSIGGTPGYNDPAERVNYDYALDRFNSILSDRAIRDGLNREGIYFRFIEDDEYGFPTNNPTN